MNVDLSLVSHTNVGKTSLMRTLLRRDIGEVADRPHVTEAAERHMLLETPQGDVLNLWDTPGFGDSARLLQRLRNSSNPLGWLQTQVWDRFVDRPFFCSQQAVRNARDAADLVLYLVNAGEDPASAAYVDAELQILEWVGKPVMLLLNQTGRPRDPAAARADEERWQRQLAAYVPAGSTLTLDAFARCWVQEDRLLRLASAMLPAEKREAFERLRGAWRERNLEVFDQSMKVLAAQLAETAADSEPLVEPQLGATLATAARRLINRGPMAEDDVDPETRAALDMAGRRLRERERAAADALISLHGLAGNAKERLFSNLAASIDVSKPIDVAKSGALGGLVTGALGGLAADIAAGGVTLGMGAILGGILGAMGAGGAAHAYNSAMNLHQGELRWSSALLRERMVMALLLYLSVAHYGRGRGVWVDQESPAHWNTLVEEAIKPRAAALESMSAQARESGSADLGAWFERELRAMAREVLVQLYPEATDLLR